jgi:transcription elongation factor GreA
MNNKNFLTREQYDEFKDRLEYLLNVALPKNSEDIASAVAQGDLSENAEYDNAKEEQGKLNQEVVKIKTILANAKIIKQNDSNDYVEVGHKVTILSLDSDVKETVMLMGYGNGKDSISVDSPLGTALLGKEKGDRITVDAPIGELKYEILDIN